MTSAIDALKPHNDPRRASEAAASALRAHGLAWQHAESAATREYRHALYDLAHAIEKAVEEFNAEIDDINERFDAIENVGRDPAAGTHPGAYGTEGDGR